jgi:hypothetical protein
MADDGGAVTPRGEAAGTNGRRPRGATPEEPGSEPEHDTDGATAVHAALQGWPPQLATTNQRVLLFTCLALVTIGLLIAWLTIFSNKPFEPRLGVTWWIKPDGAELKAGPPNFRYDAQTHFLLFRGVADAKVKEELDKLLVVDESKPQLKAAHDSYVSAVDKLVFEAHDHADEELFWLLILGGLSAALGVQIRSITGFIGNACFKNELDLRVWWPWYAMRPFLGFILGAVVIVLARADLFQPGGHSGSSNIWWVGIATLVGFGSSDFTDRMRVLVQTLLGVSKSTESKSTESKSIESKSTETKKTGPPVGGTPSNGKPKPINGASADPKTGPAIVDAAAAATATATRDKPAAAAEPLKADPLGDPPSTETKTTEAKTTETRTTETKLEDDKKH